MAKLIYIHQDDEHLYDVIIEALKAHGYAPEYSSKTSLPGGDRLRADLAIVCASEPSPNRISLGDITIDFDIVCAYDRNGQPIHFTPIEFSMLAYLIKNSHRAVSRDELLPAVWGFSNAGGTRVADDTAKRLRRKLADTNLVLETVWNYGFRLRVK